jgi:hypothetical protein
MRQRRRLSKGQATGANAPEQAVATKNKPYPALWLNRQERRFRVEENNDDQERIFSKEH